MKKSTLIIFLASLLGIPSFFVDVNNLPLVMQVSWFLVIISIGMIGLYAAINE